MKSFFYFFLGKYLCSPRCFPHKSKNCECRSLATTESIVTFDLKEDGVVLRVDLSVTSSSADLTLKERESECVCVCVWVGGCVSACVCCDYMPVCCMFVCGPDTYLSTGNVCI